MGPGALLMLAAAAAVAGITSANIALAGPYALKTVDFGACDDGEYPGMLVNVSLILDEAVNETAYTGEFTASYDYLADDCEGTYYMHRYWTRPITLKKFVALPYGKYKLYMKGLKDGKRQVCVQLVIDIYEVGFFQALGFKPPLGGSAWGRG
ncbi:uncharacterized protein LOC126108705 isoform X2 [Schistocerca cancellata]|uniref:uncharacterized protein LOC126108575 isoform X4 n=1 Tax=Schistocerca cancellata TaxID=274614 RepID=UPI0021181CBD|nr:uncharacterized protein LOC126108575 isoform X4 [Schistocerca cancellata]XP_049769980.1 uncharacterized protein LOC126108705 isoform X2 [Schistocerca cancellata]